MPLGLLSGGLLSKLVSRPRNQMVGEPTNVRPIMRERAPVEGMFSMPRRSFFPTIPTPPNPDGSVGTSTPGFGTGPMRDPRGMWGGPSTGAVAAVPGSGRSYAPNLGGGGGPMFGGIQGILSRILTMPNAPTQNNPFAGAPRGPMVDPPGMWGGPPMASPVGFGSPMAGGGLAGLLASIMQGPGAGGFMPISFAGWPGIEGDASGEDRDTRSPTPGGFFNSGLRRMAMPFRSDPGNMQHNAFGRMFGAM